MDDIVKKLRATADDTDAVENASVAYLLEEAAAEIERMRLTDCERAAVGRAMKDENDYGMVYTADVLKWLLERLSGHSGCLALDNRANRDNVGTELAQDATKTLTDAEREAVERAIETLDVFQKNGGWHSAVEDDAAALWGLLGRMA